MSSKLVLVFLLSALICTATARMLGGLEGSSAIDGEKTVVITGDGGGIDEGLGGGIVDGGIGEGIGSRIIGDGIGEGLGGGIGEGIGGGIGEGIGSRIIGDGIGEGIGGSVEEGGGYRWESGVREGNGIIGGEIP